MAGNRLADVRRLRTLEELRLLDTPAEQVLDRLTAIAARHLGVPVSLISLVTPDRQFFKSEQGLGPELQLARETPLSHSFCQHVVVDREPFVVTDARADPRVRDNPAVEDHGFVAYAGVPLRARDGEVIGSFCAIDHEPHSWDDEDLQLLHDLAATAMDVVAMRAEALATAEAAERLQRGLAPDVSELSCGQAWAHYSPGEARLLVGGDFYGCQELPDGGLALVIGDVLGQGGEAAAFATGLRSAWEALAFAGASPDQVVRALDRVAGEAHERSGLFASALICHVAADRRSARIVPAGHPAPLLVGDDGAGELCVAPGPLLGVGASVPWTVTEVALEPGAQLLLYTDGLTEARPPGAGERLGLPAVLAEATHLLAAGRRGGELLEGLVALATGEGAASLDDDVAMLLVEVG